MTDEEKAYLLAKQAELLGIPVQPDYVPGILANFNNLQALHARIVDGLEEELPGDPLPVFLPGETR